jgi:hypothetical protein
VANVSREQQKNFNPQQKNPARNVPGKQRTDLDKIQPDQDQDAEEGDGSMQMGAQNTQGAQRDSTREEGTRQTKNRSVEADLDSDDNMEEDIDDQTQVKGGKTQARKGGNDSADKRQRH